jgi:hypothetical protein
MKAINKHGSKLKILSAKIPDIPYSNRCGHPHIKKSRLISQGNVLKVGLLQELNCTLTYVSPNAKKMCQYLTRHSFWLDVICKEIIDFLKAMHPLRRL